MVGVLLVPDFQAKDNFLNHPEHALVLLERKLASDAGVPHEVRQLLHAHRPATLLVRAHRHEKLGHLVLELLLVLCLGRVKRYRSRLITH